MAYFINMSTKSVLALFCSFVLVVSQTCNPKTNTNTLYNSACNVPKPYCTVLATGYGCSSCDSGKNDFPMCDCPGNTWCTPDEITGKLDTCVPFGLGRASCSSYLDCPKLAFISTSTKIVGYFSCINGLCAPCNQTAYPNPITCPGGSPYPLTSHPGIIVKCNSTGYWEQIGTVSPASPGGGGATTTISSGTGTTLVSSGSATTSSKSTGTSNSPGIAIEFKMFVILIFVHIVWMMIQNNYQ